LRYALAVYAALPRFDYQRYTLRYDY